VRNTAAKQLAQLAARSIITDVAAEDDIKSNRQHATIGDTSAWSALLAVVARVSALSVFLLPSSGIDLSRLLRFCPFYNQRAMTPDQRLQMLSPRYLL
jgi:hypothetical protein